MTNYHRRFPTKKKPPSSESLPLLIHNAPERRVHIKTRSSRYFFFLPPLQQKISLFYPLERPSFRHPAPRDWPAAVITHAEPRARRALTFDVARHLWVTRRRSLVVVVVVLGGGVGGSLIFAALLSIYVCIFAVSIFIVFQKMDEMSAYLVRRTMKKDTWVTDARLGSAPHGFITPCKSRSIISTLRARSCCDL